MKKAAPRSRARASYESRFDHAALFEFSKVINASLDLHFVLSHILLTIMGKILSTKGMAVLATGKGRFTVEMVKGFSADLTGTTMDIRHIPASLFYSSDLSPRRHPWVKFFERVDAGILLPMFIADMPIGVLGFGEPPAKRKLHAREKTYLRSLANIAATAIEKSRSVDEIQQVNRKLDGKIQELNTLFELSKEFNSLLDPEKIIRLLVFSLLGQIGVNRYLICLRDGPDMRIAASRIDGTAPQSELLRAAARVRSATLVADMPVKQALDPRETLLALGLVVMAPMLIQDQSRGVILLGEKLNRQPFSPADLEFLSSLANLVVVSLENARLFQETIEKQKLEDELQIAREIQKGLLPGVLPSLDQMDIAAANISSKQVGGDYYDVLTVGSGKHVIAIGDVSGKGYPAALLMANLQATIRALVPLHMSLNELTARVNNLMCQNTGGDKFVTFFWGILDEAASSLTYVNAGHNYPILMHADGTLERLDKGGMILGVMETTIPYEQATVMFRPGDVLLLFTDGVSEAMSRDGQEYGEERLKKVLRTSLAATAEETAQAIHDDIRRYVRDAPQSDDITMMVLKMK